MQRKQRKPKWPAAHLQVQFPPTFFPLHYAIKLLHGFLLGLIDRACLLCE